MKAKDYFKEFQEENQEKIPEWRLIYALHGMINEVNEVAKMRSARTNSAMIAIFNEQNLKANSFIRMINQLDYFIENGTIMLNSLKMYMEQQTPDLHKMVFS